MRVLWKFKEIRTTCLQTCEIQFLPQFINKEPNFEPGKGCRYNNVAFVLLGLVIEKVTGQKYREYIKENVFEKIGMKDTGFYSMDGVNENVAEGYAEICNEKDEVIGWRKNIYSYPPIGSPDGDSLEFLINPNIGVPFQQMIDIGEMALRESIEGYEEIEWWVYDGDIEIEKILIEKGYCNSEEYRPHRVFDHSVPVEIPVLPEGYYIKNLSEVSDKSSLIYIYKNCLGMPVDEKTLKNFTENSTYRNELDVAVMASDNTVAAFCSGTYDEKNKMASFEAVACHYNHRCKGLTKVIMRYALQKARELGAEKSTVQTSDPKRHLAPNKLYESVGFKLVGNINFWRKKI